MEIVKQFFENVKVTNKECQLRQRVPANRLPGDHKTEFNYPAALKTAAMAFNSARIFEMDFELIAEAMAEDTTHEEIIEERNEPLALMEIRKSHPNTWELPAPSLYIGFVNNDIGHEDGNLFTGMLITAKVILLFGYYDKEARLLKQSSIMPLYYDGHWAVTIRDVINFWSLLALAKYAVRLINSYQTVIIDHRTQPSFNTKVNLWNKKRIVQSPRAYYRVMMQNKVVALTDTLEEAKTRKECEYAYYVIGHSRYRIRQGSLPIDPQLEAQLRKRPERRIFKDPSELDEETRKVLLRRGIYLNPGQWVAVLKTRLHGQVRNSKGGKNKFIPSVHTNVKRKATSKHN